jgi:hypothetical protein
MVQLSVISGSLAGENLFVRQFPFHVGRAAENNLCLADDGVWDHHFVLDFQTGGGFTLQTFGEAFAAVNEQPQTAVRLRNGDMLSFGSAKIRFWLAPVKQKSLRLRELSLWLLLLAVTLAQAGLLLWLRRAG